jgi:hypothetical protein
VAIATAKSTLKTVFFMGVYFLTNIINEVGFFLKIILKYLLAKGILLAK